MPRKYAIITDTDSSLPPALAEEYSIQQVPITVQFETESYTTGLDMDDARLFEIIDRRNVLPTTAAPAPSAFASAYERAFNAGADAVICVCVSSKVSGTYHAALSACENFAGRDISVVDSLSMCMGQGFMVLAAAEAARAGCSREEILAQVQDVGSRIHMYAMLPTLKYLALGGRVGKLAAGMADTFNIKPVLTMRDGKLDLLEKVRTQAKAQERILELLRIALNGKPVEKLAAIHVNNLRGAQDLASAFCAQTRVPGEPIFADFTPGLSVHAGAGVIGLTVVAAR